MKWFRPVIISAILTITILGGYHNTLNSPFVLDDEVNILRNPNVQLETLDFNSVKKVFSVNQHSSDRPVALLSFALNYFVDGYNPAGFHLVNILIHILTSLIVFKLFEWYCRTSISLEEESLRLSLIGALLWALNPIQTNAVTYIVQRMTSMSTLFIVSALLAYLYARTIVRDGKYEKNKPRTIVLFLSSFLLFVLAMLTKPIAIIFPVIIILHEVFFFNGFSSDKLLSRRFIYLSSILFVPIMLIIIYVGPDLWSYLVQGYSQRDFTMYERILTQPRVVIRYFSLFLLPLPSRLNLFYGYQISHSLFDPASTFISILIILFLILGSCLLARKYPLISFGILWTFICLVVESTFIPLELIYEHRFYLPSIGFSLVLVIFSVRFFRFFSLNNYYFDIFWICAACFLLVLTYHRNQSWGSLVLIYEDGMKKSPNSVRVVNNLGDAYMREGKIDKAEQIYQRALNLEPTNIAVLANIYIYYSQLDQRDRAEPYLERLKRSIDQNTYICSETVVVFPLTEVLSKQKRYSEVIYFLESIFNCTIKNAIYYSNLGFCYSRLNNRSKAIENFGKAVELEPENPYNVFALSREYVWAGDKNNARNTLRRLQGLSLPEELKLQTQRLEQSFLH